VADEEDLQSTKFISKFCTLVCVKRTVVILLLAAGCKKDSTVVVDAGAPVAVAAEPEDAGQVLTPAMVDAYLRYQKAVLAPQTGADGGALDRARLDEAALKANGLTEAQAQWIDEMVSVVVARRMVTQLSDNRDFMPDLEALGSSLNEEQKKHMAEAMAAFKAQQAAAKDLAEERKRFGSKNIDVLLSREAEVVKAWTEQMGVGTFGSPQLPPAPTK
jgi:hypothetical protein